MKFGVNTYGNLVVEEGRQVDTLLTCKFMQQANQAAATAWFRKLASELNGMEAESDEMAALLEAAEAKLSAAKLEEKFGGAVTF